MRLGVLGRSAAPSESGGGHLADAAEGVVIGEPSCAGLKTSLSSPSEAPQLAESGEHRDVGSAALDAAPMR